MKKKTKKKLFKKANNDKTIQKMVLQIGIIADLFDSMSAPIPVSRSSFIEAAREPLNKFSHPRSVFE